MTHLTLDPDGNMRTIPVVVTPGQVVWHSPEEYARLWQGVDEEAAEVLGSELPSGSGAV